MLAAIVENECAKRSHDHIITVTSSFSKSPFSKYFPSTLNVEPVFSISSGLKSVLKKLRFP